MAAFRFSKYKGSKCSLSALRASCKPPLFSAGWCAARAARAGSPPWPAHLPSNNRFMALISSCNIDCTSWLLGAAVVVAAVEGALPLPSCC